MSRMLFLNTGWMKKYQGIENDRITSGGAYVEQFSEGGEIDDYPPCEIHNFQPYEGSMYGFVRVEGSIRIERLGASKRDGSIDGVLVVWVARRPSYGTVVIGWFKNATVYRDCQPPPEGSGRKREGRHEWGYRVKANENDCRLLPIDQRTIKVPRSGKGSMGQSNVWYADRPVNRSFKREVREFIAEHH